MTGLVPSFGPNHPFWAEAIEMRSRQESLASLTRVANEKGHLLTYKQIQTGLKKAPLSLQLPAVSSQWLRNKYVALEKDFNAFTTMRDLTLEAINKAGEAEEELVGDDEITPSRRNLVEMNRDRWLNRAFEWAKECARIEVQVGTLFLDKAPPKEKEDIEAEFRSVMEEFNAKLPQTSAESLSQAFGGDNIRMPEKDGDK